jgi:hypothetical protein
VALKDIQGHFRPVIYLSSVFAATAVGAAAVAAVSAEVVD